MTMTETPANIFGPLFAAVQESNLFSDSKTFADAHPRRTSAEILADWHANPRANQDDLQNFVRQNFDIPVDPEIRSPEPTDLAAHIVGLWPLLTRTSSHPAAGSSELSLPYPYVVPGGRFRELYYWDSYFTMLGLVRSGHQDLVENMINNFGSLLDRLGHIPNGTRSYYTSRSHPPFFYLMAGLSRDQSIGARRQRLGWMRTEYEFWMAGADILCPGDMCRRVVRLNDGSVLNRYWDDSAAPRDESWNEDVTLARQNPWRVPAELWRDIRAAAESGWDFSSRWLENPMSLASIRTTRLVPIDLNALMFGLEQAIANNAQKLGDDAQAHHFTALADRRARAINDHLWNFDGGYYADFDLDRQCASDQLTAAAAFPLFVRAAPNERAGHTAMAITKLLRTGGLITSLCDSGEQWDAPNGWAPLQWIAVMGLHQYSETTLANEISQRWLAMVSAHFDASGQLFEKYDVVACTAGSGGEYATETGFGWTNGVTLELLNIHDQSLQANRG